MGYEDSDEFKQIIDFVVVNSSVASRFELLSEELMELGAEVSKYARLCRGEMPSNAYPSKVMDKIVEELTDVYICVKLLNLNVSDDVLRYKSERMFHRFLAKKQEETGVDQRTLFDYMAEKGLIQKGEDDDESGN